LQFAWSIVEKNLIAILTGDQSYISVLPVSTYAEKSEPMEVAVITPTVTIVDKADGVSQSSAVESFVARTQNTSHADTQITKDISSPLPAIVTTDAVKPPQIEEVNQTPAIKPLSQSFIAGDQSNISILPTLSTDADKSEPMEVAVISPTVTIVEKADGESHSTAVESLTQNTSHADAQITKDLSSPLPAIVTADTVKPPQIEEVIQTPAIKPPSQQLHPTPKSAVVDRPQEPVRSELLLSSRAAAQWIQKQIPVVASSSDDAHPEDLPAVLLEDKLKWAVTLLRDPSLQNLLRRFLGERLRIIQQVVAATLYLKFLMTKCSTTNNR